MVVGIDYGDLVYVVVFVFIVDGSVLFGWYSRMLELILLCSVVNVFIGR